MKKTINLILAVMLLIAVGVAVAFKFFSDDAAILEQENGKVKSDEIAEDEISEISSVNSDLCTLPATPREEVGGYEYPIAPQYEDLYWLGQLFTGSDCGDERLSQMPGVEDGNYTLGSTIWLEDNPEEAIEETLLETFNSIGFEGFECKDGVSATCKEWRLNKTVPVNEILKLKPYHGIFMQDDCVNCG